MDPEEYYDSLDEDSNHGHVQELTLSQKCSFEDKHVKKTKNNNKNPITTKTQDSKVEEDDFSSTSQADDDIVPFYDQNLSKSEVELKKIMFAKYRSEAGRLKNQPNRRSKKKQVVPNISGKLKSKSYLDMFYAKVGVDKMDLTSRATCIDSSPRSYETCEDFALGSFISDAGSVYISNCDINQEDLSASSTSLDSYMCSVSQQNLHVDPAPVNTKSKKCHTKPIGKKVLELGRLGPEIPKEKLDLLKRRQEYGQKVSQKNKIKIMEQRLLQNLQHEIKECRKIV